MTMKTDGRSGFNYGWDSGESGWKTGMDANLLKLGHVGYHLSVLDKDLATPPLSPSNGDAYIVAATATDDWVGQENNIAVYDTETTAWLFYAPRIGYLGYVEDEDKIYYFKAAGWAEFVSGGGASTFLELTDTPAAYTGQAAKVVVVNGTEDGLELVDAAATEVTGGIVSVPEVSEKESFTPVMANFVGTLTGQKWRIGNVLHMEIHGVATGSGSLLKLNLPDGLSIDLSVFSEINYIVPLGQAAKRSGGTKLLLRVVVGDDAQDIKIVNMTNVDNATVGSGDFLELRVAVPIAGWNTSKSINVGKIPAMFSGGASLTSSATLTFGAPRTLSWEVEDFDDKGIVDISGNPTRLTIPAGCDRATVTFKYQPSTSAQNDHFSYIQKNGTTPIVQFSTNGDAPEYAGGILTTGVIDVVEGDYFEAQISPVSADYVTDTVGTVFNLVTWNSASPRASAFKGALLVKATTQTLTAQTFEALTFGTSDTEEYDTDGFHESVTNPTRITIPAGVSKVRLAAATRSAFETTTGRNLFEFRKNGTAVFNGNTRVTSDADSYASTNAISPVINVSQGDYFEAFAYLFVGGNLESNGQVWFSIEVVE